MPVVAEVERVDTDVSCRGHGRWNLMSLCDYVILLVDPAPARRLARIEPVVHCQFTMLPLCEMYKAYIDRRLLM